MSMIELRDRVRSRLRERRAGVVETLSNLQEESVFPYRDRTIEVRLIDEFEQILMEESRSMGI